MNKRILPIIKTDSCIKKLVGFAAIFIFWYLIGNIIILILTSCIKDPLNAMKCAQLAGSICIFIITPITYQLFFSDNIKGDIGLGKIDNWRMPILGIIAMYAALPFINQLTIWNESITLPKALESLEIMMKIMEENAKAMTEQMLIAENFWGLLTNIVIIAIVPAIGEELTFRGVLQNILVRHTKNAHIAIIAAAALFSAIHMQFYGFLPRMLLGIIMGYFYYYTKNIWVPILMHFVNNATVTVLEYLHTKGISDIDPESFGRMTSPLAIALSAAAIVISIVIIAKPWRNKNIAQDV